MGSASYFFCLLMLVATSTFIVFNSQLDFTAWDLRGNDSGSSNTGTGFLEDEKEMVEKVSGEDNVGGEVLSKIRILLGLESSNPKGATNGVELKIHQFGPAPAPAPAPTPIGSNLIQAPFPPLHAHFHSRSPLPHKSRAPPVHELEKGGRHGSKAKTIVAAVVSLGATIIIFGTIMVIVGKRCRRSRKRSQRSLSVSSRSKVQIPPTASNKVSSDPGPDLFYLNSLAPFLQIESSCKISSECKNVLSNESTMTSPSHTGESIKCEMDNVSCLDEEIDPIDSPSSDDESFHSVCNSHSRKSFVLDENLSHPSAACSPFSSSYRSTSPNCISTNYSFAPMPHSDSIPWYPQNSPSLSLKSKTSQAPVTSSIWNGGSLLFTHPLLPPSTHKKIKDNLRDIKHTYNSQATSVDSHSPHKDSESSAPRADIPSDSLSTVELSSIPVHTTQEPAISSPNKMIVSDNRSQFSPMLIHIPKPPPPPQYPLVHGSGKAPKPPPPPQYPLVRGNSKAPKPPPLPQPPPVLRNVSIPKPPPPPQSPSVLHNKSMPKPPPPPLKPPQFQNGCNSSHPPLPPPCLPQQSTPVGKDGAPLPKLKPLHWDKVRAAPDRSMVWDKIRSSSFELDEEMIESLFGYSTRSSAKNEEVKSKSSSPGKHVLDNKRLQNITILLKALNVTAEQVCDALVQGEGLNSQQLEALVKMAPTKEEEVQLFKYDGDINELGPAEQFIKAMLNMPCAFSRIEVLLYKETFEDEVIHLRKSFAILEEACKELRSSQLFLRLLEAVLKTGNRMNVGTIRGGARAFKLDALLKLADVKGTDGKTTLLHFVVQEMIRSEGVSVMEKAIQAGVKKNKHKTAEEKEEDIRLMGLDLVSGLNTELSNVKKTASIDLDVLVTSVTNLSNGAGHLKHLIEVDLSSGDKNWRFVFSMKSFMNHAHRIIKELKDDEDKVLLHVRQITEYYHGDVSKDEVNPLRIFVIVRDFLSMLDRVCKDVRNLKTHLGANPVIPFR